MSLRLVAVDGELVDRPAHPAPDFNTLSRRGRDVIYMLTIGDLPVTGGQFSISHERLGRMMGWGSKSGRKVLHELQVKGFIRLEKEAQGCRPRVWRLHEHWNPPSPPDARAQV